MKTPYYCFDIDIFEEKIEKVKKIFPICPLTFSMKSNPFLIERIPDSILHIEVCSPGELDICIERGISPEKILYSGVVKEEKDIRKAIDYGVKLITCESIMHADILNSINSSVNVLLRITSGNQFGMSLDDAKYILKQAGANGIYEKMNTIGIHFYSGTQKNIKKIKKDLEQLEIIINELETECGFEPSLVEYGPGLFVDYYSKDESDDNYLLEVADCIEEFIYKYPVAIELGRYLTADCGTYYTTVKEKKVSYDTTYLMIDGGIHHINYYGQNMAMRNPPVRVIHNNEPIEGEKEAYCVCGSLCTVADVMMREIELPSVSYGDVLAFGKCGAYAMTEGPLLFLSREMPAIYLHRKGEKDDKVRGHYSTSVLNMRSYENE